ncbi:hypothetical protein C8R32_10860 [Nitrosospira sp. Nsp5]|uniref:Uncharacterized protein n=1 Tax=Nitrosospira multiformis TaxID=1231 RepID=A0ABY0T728_9PROT|nr:MULTISPECIES: hypothetical protein [Nitrosospira]PTR07104.1 hypothetical protein C8R32_10860 [Nitrosospira sp. Nsp5]SDQ33630.1 hypothetical protein SAMN05216402_0438 [Nitrosospira multiformis]
MQALDWFTIGRVGLLYDLFGALILVWGYMLQGKKEFQEAIAFPGPDVPIQPVTTKFDSIVGLTFIMLGFSGQLAGTDSDAEAVFSSCRGCAISALIVLIVGGGSYLLFRKILFAHYIAYINKGGPK